MNLAPRFADAFAPPTPVPVPGMTVPTRKPNVLGLPAMGGGGGGGVSEIDAAIAALKRERDQLGLTGLALAEYNALVQAGIDRNNPRAGEVLAVADALFAEQQAIKAAADEQERFNGAMADLGDISLGTLRGIVDAFRDGKIEASEWGDILESLGSRFIDLAFSALGNGNIFGNLFGGIFGGGRGGNLAPRGGLIPSAGGGRIGPAAAADMNVHVHIDGARGRQELEDAARAGTVKALQAYDRGFKGKVAQALAHPRER